MMTPMDVDEFEPTYGPVGFPLPAHLCIFALELVMDNTWLGFSRYRVVCTTLARHWKNIFLGLRGYRRYLTPCPPCDLRFVDDENAPRVRFDDCGARNRPFLYRFPNGALHGVGVIFDDSVNTDIPVVQMEQMWRFGYQHGIRTTHLNKLTRTVDCVSVETEPGRLENYHWGSRFGPYAINHDEQRSGKISDFGFFMGDRKIGLSTQWVKPLGDSDVTQFVQIYNSRGVVQKKQVIWGGAAIDPPLGQVCDKMEESYLCQHEFDDDRRHASLRFDVYTHHGLCVTARQWHPYSLCVFACACECEAKELADRRDWNNFINVLAFETTDGKDRIARSDLGRREAIERFKTN